MYLVPGTWYLVPSIWYLIPGTCNFWYLIPGTWYLVPDSWYLIPGTWCLVSGTWFQWKENNFCNFFCWLTLLVSKPEVMPEYLTKALMWCDGHWNLFYVLTRWSMVSNKNYQLSRQKQFQFMSSGLRRLSQIHLHTSWIPASKKLGRASWNPPKAVASITSLENIKTAVRYNLIISWVLHVMKTWAWEGWR